MSGSSTVTDTARPLTLSDFLSAIVCPSQGAARFPGGFIDWRQFSSGVEPVPYEPRPARNGSGRAACSARPRASGGPGQYMSFLLWISRLRGNERRLKPAARLKPMHPALGLGDLLRRFALRR